MEDRMFETDFLDELYNEIGFRNPAGGDYKERVRKSNQVNDYLGQIIAAIKRLSTKKELVLLDCGCGRSYLSFVIYHYCQEIINRKIRIIGVDRNPELIRKCRQTAENLGFSNVDFYSQDIFELELETPPDIVYSLHACDTATDMTIAKGIAEGAKYIFTVSCCQHTTMKQIRHHPWSSITRFKPYKERVVDMVSDSMRALLLEKEGYKVDIFEFTTSMNTAKNVMVRAQKCSRNSDREERAATEYDNLLKTFHIQPLAEAYMKRGGKGNAVGQ